MTCTLSPRRRAEGLRAQDGAVSCQTLSSPRPEGAQSGSEGQAEALLGGVGNR